MDANYLSRLPPSSVSPKSPKTPVNQFRHSPHSSPRSVKRKLFFDNNDAQSSREQQDASSPISSSSQCNDSVFQAPPSPSSCRFIPNRNASDLKNGFLAPSPPRQVSKSSSPNIKNGIKSPRSSAASTPLAAGNSLDAKNDDKSFQRPDSASLYEAMLANELGLNAGIFKYSNNDDHQISQQRIPFQSLSSPTVLTPMTRKYTVSPLKAASSNPLCCCCNCESLTCNCSCHQYSRYSNRKILPHPVKILDAPYLQDDFYLNLVDWGPSNLLVRATFNLKWCILIISCFFTIFFNQFVISFILLFFFKFSK